MACSPRIAHGRAVHRGSRVVRRVTLFIIAIPLELQSLCRLAGSRPAIRSPKLMHQSIQRSVRGLAAAVVISFLVTGLANAAPAISGISGSPSNGQVIIIKGSGFGTKSPAAPLWYFPFGEGIRGTHPTLSRN